MSDEEWELVANPVRVKREARKVKRAHREEENETEKRHQFELEADEMSREMNPRRRNVASLTSSSLVEVPRVAVSNISSRRAAKNARKGKSKSATKSVRLPQNEPDLVEFVQKLLVLESKSLTIAELGARVQASARTSWNKAFKSSYGAMDKFLKAHSEVFHVAKDRGETMVSLQMRKPAKKKGTRPVPDVSPSSSPQPPRVSKPRVSFAESPVKNGVEKKSSKPAATESSVANGRSKKSKRKRTSQSSDASSSVCWSSVMFLFLVFALLVSGLLFLRYQDEALFLSYQDGIVKFIDKLLTDFL